MHEIVDDLYQRATDFVHDSSIRMDEDFVGKQPDLYFWCSVGGSKIGVSGVARCGSRAVVLAQSALRRCRVISLFSFMENIIRGAYSPDY